MFKNITKKKWIKLISATSLLIFFYLMGILFIYPEIATILYVSVILLSVYQVYRMNKNGIYYEDWINGEVDKTTWIFLLTILLPTAFEFFRIIIYNIIYVLTPIVFISSLWLILFSREFIQLYQLKNSYYSKDISIKSIEKMLRVKNIKYKKNLPNYNPSLLKNFFKIIPTIKLSLNDYDIEILQVDNMLILKPVSFSGKKHTKKIIKWIEE